MTKNLPRYLLLLCLLAIGCGTRSAWADGGPLGVFIVSDPTVPATLAIESQASNLLRRLRAGQHIDPLRLPIEVFHLASDADATFVHERLSVSRDQVPFVGLAHVDADGLPTRFVLRYLRVSDPDTTARAIFSHALEILQWVGRDSRIPDQPPPSGPDRSLPDALRSGDAGAVPSLSSPAMYPAGVPPEIRSQPDDADMVLIPGGPFSMGSTLIDDESPARTVTLAPFYLDRYPVTNRQFERFVTATHYVTDAERKGWSIVYFGGEPRTRSGACWRSPGGVGSAPYTQFMDYPVVHVSWNDADAYCRWANKRLPSEQEWEKAARGVDARVFPWGNDEDESRSNSRYLQRGDVRREAMGLDYTHGPIPVGSLPDGASPYGIMDMAGNVAEWVEDWYHPYPGSTRPVGEGEGSHKVLRGGGWNDDLLWSAWRAHSWPEATTAESGFRTCRDVLPQVPPPPAP